MPAYAVLLHPGHNRVYFNASRALSLRELQLALPAAQAVREAEPGGVPYLFFDTAVPLGAADLRLLSRLSFAYALFERRGDGALLPLVKDAAYAFPDEVSMMLKYAGKTHELFTRLMLNISLRYVRAADEALCILDPLCGKGTTLFESLMQGHHAAGIELDEKLAHEAYIFFKKYAETAKIKHTVHMEKAGGTDGDGKRFNAMRYRIEGTKTPFRFEVVAGNTVYANHFFKKNSFHAIVGDLPYGVQHGSAGKGKQRGITRNAMGLMAEALPEWLKVLKPGGVVTLAWNLFLIPRADMEALFAQHRLTVPTETREAFAHRVDQAIHRDFIVGVKV